MIHYILRTFKQEQVDNKISKAQLTTDTLNKLCMLGIMYANS